MRQEHIAVFLVAASIFSMGGVIFGIASLYPVLYHNRALELSSCAVQIVDEDGHQLILPHKCEQQSREKCCPAQELKYTGITSVALFGADGAMLIYGELGDRLGPRTCFGVGASLAWFGLLLLAIAAQMDSDMMWYGALFSIGISGPGVFMGCLFMGEKHPNLRAVISAVGAAMWDGSALVFKLFALAYDANAPASAAEVQTFGLSAIALGWLAWSFIIGSFTWCALPSRALLEQLRAAEGAASAPLTQADEVGESGAVTTRAEPRSSGAPASFMAYYCRGDTRLLLLFMAIFNLKSSFYIATFSSQSSAMFYQPTADSLTDTFNFAFPVGGFCTSVVASILLEKLGDREDLYMTLVVLLAIMFGLYNLLPYGATQFASALLFGPTRTLQWACYFHFLSLPKRYPPQYVGRLLGYGNLIIALVGDVPLSGLNAFVLYSKRLASPAARYLLVHFVLQLALIGCLVLPWYLHRQHLANSQSTSMMGSAMDPDTPGTQGRTANARSTTRDDNSDDDDTRSLDDGRGLELTSTRSAVADDAPDPPPLNAVASSGGGPTRPDMD